MGKLIDIDKARKEYSNLTDLTMNDTTLLLTLFDVLDNAPTVEAIPKADYEARLKADMVAMLTELQLEIEEREQYYKDKFLEPSNAVHDAAMGGRMFGCGDCKEIIQQKINSLKVESEDKE